MHPFDAAVRLEPQADGRLLGRTSPAYANMVGPFGGVTAACMLQAVRQHPARIGEPIALTVNFAGALADGEFLVAARPARTNRSTQHWVVEATQHDETAVTATAVFAVRRETWGAREAVPPADVPPAESLLPRASAADAPPWTRHVEMRFVRGGLPDVFDGVEQPESTSCVWLRDAPPRPLDFAGLASLCDSFFPRVFLRRRKRVPIGTVSMTTYFHADAAMLAAQADRPILGNVRAVNFRNGYFDQSAEVWSDAHELLATTHQVVYFRA